MTSAAVQLRAVLEAMEARRWRVTDVDLCGEAFDVDVDLGRGVDLTIAWIDGRHVLTPFGLSPARVPLVADSLDDALLKLDALLAEVAP